MSGSKAVFINGKFTTQRMTGVQRVAAEMVRALDASLGAQPDAGPWILLCPAAASVPVLEHIQVCRVGPPDCPLHVWEQVFLPWAARSGLLVNLSGSSPWFGGRQACVLHDAALFDRPQSYGWAFSFWYRALFRRQAVRAVVLVTISMHARSRLCLHLGLSQSRLQVVHNGGDHLDAVEADARTLEGMGLTGLRFVLAVGSASPGKNLPRLLKAMDLLPPTLDLHLVVVGGQNPHVFASTSGISAGPRVRLVGEVPDSSLKALYQAALGLVFPSLYEGFGLPPLEAMSCGCPVLASSATAIPEVCGHAAGYFDPESAESIAQAIVGLATDPDLRQILVAAGYRRVRELGWMRAASGLRQVVAAAR